MHELATIIRKFAEAYILDDPTVPVSDLWTLLTTTYGLYAKKYQRYRGSPTQIVKEEVFEKVYAIL